MKYDLNYQVRKEDLTLRRMFVEAISETTFLESVKKEAEVFHDTLSLAQDRNWIKPTILAKELDVSESNTRKWFKKDPNERSTPSYLIMVEAFKAISKLMAKDIKSLHSDLDSLAVSLSKAKEKEKVIQHEVHKEKRPAVA
jgi:hypothetical protein